VAVGHDNTTRVDDETRAERIDATRRRRLIVLSRAALPVLPAPILEKLFEEFLKRRPRWQLGHGAASQIDRLLGRNVYDGIDNLLRHIGDSLRSARGRWSRHRKKGDGCCRGYGQAGPTAACFRAESVCAHGRQFSWE
jgi:hypothetical protein